MSRHLNVVRIIVQKPRPCAGFFNAGCNEHVFASKPWKKIGADPSCPFRKKHKKHITPMHFNFKKVTSPSRKLGYSNNQLNCL